MDYWNIIFICDIFISLISTMFIFFGISRFFKYKNKCHLNFWIIVSQIHFDLILLTICNLIMATCGFFICEDLTKIDFIQFKIFKYFNSLATLASNSIICLFTLVFFERLMATTFTNTYEKSKNVLILIFGSCLCWIYGLGNFLCWNVFYVDISLLSMISYGASVLDFICILILWNINRHAKKIRSSSVLALSTRYQIDENVRMTTYIAPFLFLGTIFTILFGLGSEYLEHLLGITGEHPCSPLLYYLLLNSMVLTIYIYETCLKFGLDEKLGQLLHKTKMWQHHKFHKNPMITDEGNHYFQELRKVWNTS